MDNLMRWLAGYRVQTDRFWLTRHYIALSTLCTFYIAAFAPESLNHRALQVHGEGAWIFLAALSIFSTVCLLEASVTVFVPWVRLEWFRERRHIGLVAIAIGQVCLSWIVTTYSPNSSALIARFMLDAAAALFVAFADLFARHKPDGGFR